VEHLPPRVLRAFLDVYARGACLDELPVADLHHQLSPELGRKLSQADECDDEHDQADDAADDELVLPRMEMIEGVARDQRHGQAGDDRTHRPEPGGQASPELWGEVANEGRRRHEDDALDEAEGAVEHGVDPQVGGIGKSVMSGGRRHGGRCRARE
jgi:hypothetical protein